MNRRQLALIATLLLGIFGVVLWLEWPTHTNSPVVLRVDGFENNSLGYTVNFSVTNISSHYLILELSTESLVDGDWTAKPLGGFSGFGIEAEEQSRINTLVATNTATYRAVVDCIRIPRNRLLREIDIILGTYFGKPDKKVRCYSEPFHVPPKS